MIENDINLETGLNLLEQECMDKLIDSYHAFLKLERQHPEELKDFVTAMHRIQDLLAIRVVRRLYPDGWYKGK